MRAPTVVRNLFRVAIPAALLVVAGCTGAPGGSAGTGNTSVFDLSNGQCFNAVSEDVVDEVEVVACGQAHQYEIYLTVDYDAGSGAAYPGDATITDFSEDTCRTRFETFVGRGYEESELFIYYLQPSDSSWGDGDREVVCSLYLPDEQLTGSMENSGR